MPAAATLEALALRVVARAPAMVPRRVLSTVLYRMAQGAAATPVPDVSTSALVGIATYSMPARASAVRALADRAVPRSLLPYALAAAAAQRDEWAIEVLGRAEPPAVSGSAAAVASADWDAVIRLSEGLERGYVERWVVAAVDAGHYRAAIALGLRLSRQLPLDVKRALAEAADGMAVLAGSLDTLSHVASAVGHAPHGNAVLYVAAQSLPYRNGGYATRTHGLLSALAASGWLVRALTRLNFPQDQWPRGSRRSTEPMDQVDAIEYWRAGRGPERVPRDAHALAFAAVVEQHVREHRASIVHAASFPSTALGAALAANALGLPFVYEVRALEALYRASEEPEFVGSDAHDVLMRAELAVCARADAVLTITDAIAALLAAEGVDQAKITTVPNAVDPQAFEPSPADPQLAARLGLAGRMVIGYAGAMLPYEGLDLLLDALDIVSERHPEIALVALGDGPELAGLRARAERSAYPVVLPGRLPHGEVARHLALAQICPFPRRSLPITEAVAPMKPFEAMALGKAVVVSDVAALREVVSDGVTGLVVPAGDPIALASAIERLLDDPDLRERVGADARASVATDATWQSRASSVGAVYSALGGSVSS